MEETHSQDFGPSLQDCSLQDCVPLLKRLYHEPLSEKEKGKIREFDERHETAMTAEP